MRWRRSAFKLLRSCIAASTSQTDYIRICGEFKKSLGVISPSLLFPGFPFCIFSLSSSPALPSIPFPPFFLPTPKCSYNSAMGSGDCFKLHQQRVIVQVTKSAQFQPQNVNRVVPKMVWRSVDFESRTKGHHAGCSPCVT